MGRKMDQIRPDEPVPEPRISVIIPAYNAAATIGEAVHSVLAQHWENIECIVVNDGSTDNTAEVLEPWRDRICYIEQANGGFAAARNLGMQQARGEWIAWLDADDIFQPDKLLRQMALVRRYPEVSLVCSDFSMFDEGGERCGSGLAQYYGVFSRGMTLEQAFEQHTKLANGDNAFVGNVFDALLQGNFLHPPTAMFRKAVFEQVGPQCTSLVNATDYEYFLRIARRFTVGYVDAPLLRYRLSPAQSSAPANFARNARYNEMALEHVLASYPLDRVQWALVRRRLRATRLARARHLAAGHKREALRNLAAMPAALFSLAGVLVLLKVMTPMMLLELRRRWLQQRSLDGYRP